MCTGKVGMVDGLDDVLNLLLVDRPGERSDEEDIQAVSEGHRGQNAEDTLLIEDSTVDRFSSPPTALPGDNGSDG